MKLALISTFHKESIPYHDECMKSIVEQSDSDFRFYLFLDEMELKIPSIDNPMIISENVTQLSPREIKQRGIVQACSDRCDYICFIDSDDVMKLNRIQKVKQYLLQHEPQILIHNLSTIDSMGKLLQKDVFLFEKDVLNNEYFRHKNVSGFGNTIYKAEALSKLLPLSERSYSLDWEFIFILSLKHQVNILRDSMIYYRQHNRNVVGINNRIDNLWLDRRMMIRELHYTALEEYFRKRKDIESQSIVSKIQFEWSAKKQHIMSNYDEYIDRIKTHANNLVWQELI